MFVKFIASRATGIIRPFVRNSSAYVPPPHIKQPVLNDVLVPSGSWKEGYDKLQRKFNAQLFAGVVFFVTTVGIAAGSGSFELFLTPPKEDMKKIEC